ncbi:MAG: hypothetical protein GXC70_11700 [Sphingomonadaceae bacterium]|nr:hypothetical protein [Sphingomonadaceae bacterium]
MKTLSRALVGTIAAGAMAVSSAAPAFADTRSHDRDGISAGEIIAGALIIGGIAAIATSGNRNDRDYRYGDYRDQDYRDGGYRYGRAGYGYRDNPRQAVEQCVRAAERYAQGRYRQADVTDVRQIKDTRYGFEVKGRIAVNTRGQGWRQGDYRYGNGWGGDYRGWNNGHRGFDSGSFKCKIERGRVVDLDIDGIRGL